MTALELLTNTNQVLFVGLFLAVLARAARQPTRANLDAVLLFGGIAAVVVVSRVSQSMAQLANAPAGDSQPRPP